MKRLILLLLQFVLPLAQHSALAEDAPRAKLAGDQILQEVGEAATLYTVPSETLSKRDRWKIRLHGLRMAPLNPSVWAMRRIDRTDNRRLVPIRPYYLRVSESAAFTLKEIRMRFRFDPTSSEQAASAPSLFTPLCDIEFAGAFRMGLPGERPPEDSAYVFRISASPLFPSGFRYRSHITSVATNASSMEFTTNKTYTLRFVVSDTEARAYVDDQLVSEQRGEGLNKGLVSIDVDWLPLALELLEVEGSLENESGEPQPYFATGLVALEAPK